MPKSKIPLPQAVKTKSKTLKSTSKPLPRSWEEVEVEVKNVKATPKIPENIHSKQYPSPSEDVIFKSKWNEFIQNVAVRDNFNRGHLEQLSLLCDLYVDYERLTNFVNLNGYSYTAEGQSGTQVKPYPEVGIRTRVLTEIRNYSKVLGLVLVKDNSSRDAEKDQDAWE